MRIFTTDWVTPPGEGPSGPDRSTARGSSAGRLFAGIARERASPVRIAGVSIAVAAISAGLAWAATRAALDDAALEPALERRVVRVAPVGVIEEAHELRFPGTTRAVRRANLSFVVGGRLSERAVDLGDRVARGTPLARLDPQPFLNEVRSAEAVVAEVGARLEQISRDRHRLTRLRAGGVASEQELERTSSSQDQLRASVALAESRLREARRLLAEATLVAPFDGTVTAVHREPGEFVQEGAAVLAISGDDGFEIEVEVPESVASTLVEGQAATVSFPLAGVPAAPAWLKSVSRGTEGPGRLFPIVAQLQPTPGVIPGMAGELIVRASRGSHLAVPLASIIDPSGKHPYVFRVADGRAERVPVEVRTLVGERITVVGALQAGDRVVVAGHAVLLDGDPVEVR
jgi:RND family efflux transporter MFP subunit